jgi:hypothetical protein
LNYIIQKLTEYDIPDWQISKSAIVRIFDEIGQENLRAVFETWINRFGWVTEREGEDFHHEMKNERKRMKTQ